VGPRNGLDTLGKAYLVFLYTWPIIFGLIKGNTHALNEVENTT